MITFLNSPRLLKGGNVLIDVETSAVQRIIVQSYNLGTLSRTLLPQAVKESGVSWFSGGGVTPSTLSVIQSGEEIDGLFRTAQRRHLNFQKV
jgi:hypothetical protein